MPNINDLTPELQKELRAYYEGFYNAMAPGRKSNADVINKHLQEDLTALNKRDSEAAFTTLEGIIMWGNSKLAKGILKTLLDAGIVPNLRKEIFDATASHPDGRVTGLDGEMLTFLLEQNLIDPLKEDQSIRSELRNPDNTISTSSVAINANLFDWLQERVMNAKDKKLLERYNDLFNTLLKFVFEKETSPVRRQHMKGEAGKEGVESVLAKSIPISDLFNILGSYVSPEAEAIFSKYFKVFRDYNEARIRNLLDRVMNQEKQKAESDSVVPPITSQFDESRRSSDRPSGTAATAAEEEERRKKRGGSPGTGT